MGFFDFSHFCNSRFYWKRYTFRTFEICDFDHLVAFVGFVFLIESSSVTINQASISINNRQSASIIATGISIIAITLHAMGRGRLFVACKDTLNKQWTHEATHVSNVKVLYLSLVSIMCYT